MPTRRRTLAATAVLLAPLLVVPLTAPAASADGSLASSIAVEWQRTAARTIYVERGTPPPLGSLYLAFASLAVHDAAREAQRHGSHAAAAAVATAAHDVLREYFSLSGDALDADLAASLAKVPDGTKQDVGVAIGAAAADEMIASRVGDGRDDASIVYTKTAALGIWPAVTMAGGMPLPGMALPWLGFVDLVVDVDLVARRARPTAAPHSRRTTRRRARWGRSRDQPYPGADRRRRCLLRQPDADVLNALCDYLATEPLGLLLTTRLFAASTPPRRRPSSRAGG